MRVVGVPSELDFRVSESLKRVQWSEMSESFGEREERRKRGLTSVTKSIPVYEVPAAAILDSVASSWIASPSNEVSSGTYLRAESQVSDLR